VCWNGVGKSGRLWAIIIMTLLSDAHNGVESLRYNMNEFLYDIPTDGLDKSVKTHLNTIDAMLDKRRLLRQEHLS
jgi:hypothetical protein